MSDAPLSDGPALRELQVGGAAVAVATAPREVILRSPAARFAVSGSGPRRRLHVVLADGTESTGAIDATTALVQVVRLTAVHDAARLRRELIDIGVAGAVETPAPPSASEPSAPSGAPELPEVGPGLLERRLRYFCDKAGALSPGLFASDIAPYVLAAVEALTPAEQLLLYRIGRKADSPYQLEQEILARVWTRLPQDLRARMHAKRADRAQSELRRAGTTIYPDARVPTGWLPYANDDGAGDLIQFSIDPPDVGAPHGSKEEGSSVTGGTDGPAAFPEATVGPVVAAATSEIPAAARSARPDGRWRARQGVSRRRWIAGTFVAGAGSAAASLVVGPAAAALLALRPLIARGGNGDAHGRTSQLASRLGSAGGVAALLHGTPLRSPYRFDAEGPTSRRRVGDLVCVRKGWRTSVFEVTDRRDGSVTVIEARRLCPRCHSLICEHAKAARACARAEIRFLNGAGEHDEQMLRLRDGLAQAWEIRPRSRLERMLRLGEARTSAEDVGFTRFSYRLADPETAMFEVRDEVLGRIYEVTPGGCACGAERCAHHDFILQDVHASDLTRQPRDEDVALSAPARVYVALAQWHAPDLEQRIRKNDRQEMARYVRRALLDGGGRSGRWGTLQLHYDPLADDVVQVRSKGRNYGVDANFECSCGQNGCTHARTVERALDRRLTKLREASRYDADYQRIYEHVRSTFRMAHHADLPPAEPARVSRVRPHGLWGRSVEQLHVSETGAKQYLVEDLALKAKYPITGPTCGCGSFRRDGECAHVNLVRSHIDQKIQKAYELFWNARRAEDALGGAEVPVRAAARIASARVGAGGGVLDAYGLEFLPKIAGTVAGLFTLGRRGRSADRALGVQRAVEQARARIDHWKSERTRFTQGAAPTRRS